MRSALLFRYTRPHDPHRLLDDHMFKKGLFYAAVWEEPLPLKSSQTRRPAPLSRDLSLPPRARTAEDVLPATEPRRTIFGSLGRCLLEIQAVMNVPPGTRAVPGYGVLSPGSEAGRR